MYFLTWQIPSVRADCSLKNKTIDMNTEISGLPYHFALHDTFSVDSQFMGFDIFIITFYILYKQYKRLLLPEYSTPII
jgi:hypothetical protein